MRYLVLTVLSSLSLAVFYDDADGCWKPIPTAAIVAVSGSSGYSAVCPRTNTSLVDVIPDQTGGPMTALEVGDFTKRSRIRRHRGPLRTRGSFIQASPAQQSPYSVCLTPSDSASADPGSMSVKFELSSQYVIRGAGVYDPTSSSASSLPPNGFTINTQSSSTSDTVWYSSLTDQDSALPWSTLPSGKANQFNDDMTGQFINVFPKLPSTANGPAKATAFGITFMGCTVDQTALISFRFQSSKNAIAARFGVVSAFITQLTNYVCLMSGFVTSPGPCPRIIFADMQEATAANPDLTADSPFQPATITTLEVFFRILPPQLYACENCRSAEVVQAMIQYDLKDAKSKNSKILQAIDSWIADPDPYMCYGKTCPNGFLCVSGVCLTAMDVYTKETTNLDVDFAKLFHNSTLMDLILNLSPLQVIAGVDQSQGRIFFSNNPPAAGTVAGSAPSKASTEATVKSDDESFLHRFMIPIIAVSVFTLIILGILGWKAYSRMNQGSTSGVNSL